MQDSLVAAGRRRPVERTAARRGGESRVTVVLVLMLVAAPALSVSTADWADYLAWYRRFLDIAVRYGTRLLRIEPSEGHFRLCLENEAGASIETARKVILANGVAGNGGSYVPPVLSEALPQRLYAHTAAA